MLADRRLGRVKEIEAAGIGIQADGVAEGLIGRQGFDRQIVARVKTEVRGESVFLEYRERRLIG